VVPGLGLPGRLLFAAAGELWLWQGEHGRQLTSSGDAFQPALAPDGSRIAYVRRSQSASDLVELNLASGKTQALTTYTPDQPLGSIERVYESMWAFYPAWSPDGTELAFVSQYGPPYGDYASDYRLGIYTMPPQPGAERSRRYIDEHGQIGRMAYMPDGSAILYAFAPDPPGIPRIYRYDRVTEEAGDLPGMPEQSYDPAISPDGKIVAFAARHATTTDIFLMPLAGGTPTQITRIGAARAPAFSPDGKQIAFIAAAAGERGFDIWVVELTPAGATQPRRISFDLGVDADSGLSWGR
jgi:TolB protein